MNVNVVLLLKKILIPTEKTSAITFDMHYNLQKAAYQPTLICGVG